MLGFLGDVSEPVDEVSPYFLGSIVLIKEDNQPRAEVVDGQQRLMTLTVLLADLRALVQPTYASEITPYLYQKGSVIAGRPNRYRLRLRERDAEFFKQHIQDEDGLERLCELQSVHLSDSQRNIQQNALLFLKRLNELTEEQRVRLAQFIISRCFLVVDSTPDLDSAYRIFSVLNDRGLDLGLTDILKSEVIGRIPPAEQDAYTQIWEAATGVADAQSFGQEQSEILLLLLKGEHARKVRWTGGQCGPPSTCLASSPFTMV